MTPHISTAGTHLFASALLVLLTLPGSHAIAASPLFDDGEVAEVTLAGPFESLFDRAHEPTYLAFTLEADGLKQALRVQLRGHSRLRVCEFPPLRLLFSNGIETKGVFAGQHKLKLVTHCRNSDRGEQDLLEEYAAYRILNNVTDLSYRVRLLRIHYEDSKGALPPKARLRFGFVIESDEEFAARTGMTPVVVDGFPRYRHDLRQAALVYVLQYLIGNTDWQLLKADYDTACCHNLDLYEWHSRIVFVPYDFDLTGLVNARYAHPDPRLRIRTVRQRLYRGLCTDHEHLEQALRTIKSKRKEIMAVVRDLPGLEPRNADRATGYLDSFFNQARNEGQLLTTFEKHCLDRY